FSSQSGSTVAVSRSCGARVGTGALARPSRAQLGSCLRSQQFWIAIAPRFVSGHRVSDAVSSPKSAAPLGARLSALPAASLSAAEKLVDPTLQLIGTIDLEIKFRRAAQTQAFREFVPHEILGSGEPFEGALGLGLIAGNAHHDASGTRILGHKHGADAGQPDPRIGELAFEDGFDLFAYGRAQPSAMILLATMLHGTPRIRNPMSYRVKAPLWARAQAAAVATWVRAVSSRDFSASRRTCKSGRKCFSFSRLPRYSRDSFSNAAAPSECAGRRRRHSAARRSWLSMSEKSCGLMLEQCFRSGRRRSSAERRL